MGPDGRHVFMPAIPVAAATGTLLCGVNFDKPVSEAVVPSGDRSMLKKVLGPSVVRQPLRALNSLIRAGRTS